MSRAKQTKPAPMAMTVEVGMLTPVSLGLGGWDCVGVGSVVELGVGLAEDDILEY